jgi:hypothetical protein
MLALAGCPGTINLDDYIVGPRDSGVATDAASEVLPEPACPDIPRTVLATATCSALGCHAPPAPGGNLDLQSPNVASRLVGVEGTSGVPLIDPASPEQSLLYRRVTGATPPRMPSVGPPLDDATTACLLSWIKSVSNTPDPGGANVADASMPMGDDAGKTVVRVACGSTSSVTDHNNNAWAADTGYSAGQTAVQNPPHTIANTMDQTLYNAERWGGDDQGKGIPFTYDFTVPNGGYNVTLKFAETYWTQAGQRVFAVSINGESKLTNYDILSVAGGKDIAHDEVFQIDVTGGKVTIQFELGAASNPKIDAIEILSR